MLKVLDLMAPATVTRGVPFVVSVEVRGATPGQQIAVSLEKKVQGGTLSTLRHGVADATDAQATFTSFQVTLEETGTTLLLVAAHDDAGGHFRHDGAVIDVV